MNIAMAIPMVHGKMEPFKIEIFKHSDFEWIWYSDGQNSSPYHMPNHTDFLWVELLEINCDQAK